MEVFPFPELANYIPRGACCLGRCGPASFRAWNPPGSSRGRGGGRASPPLSRQHRPRPPGFYKGGGRVRSPSWARAGPWLPRSCGAAAGASVSLGPSPESEASAGSSRTPGPQVPAGGGRRRGGSCGLCPLRREKLCHGVSGEKRPRGSFGPAAPSAPRTRDAPS